MLISLDIPLTYILKFLYNIGIRLYPAFVRIASAFNAKAGLFYNGRKGLLQRIAKEVPSDVPLIWFHCSSVGEFEQARPVMEWYKKERPGYKLLLTFFSPSGYELRKNYELADWVYYMPVDTPENAKAFVKAVNPRKAIFIKYEFWYNYLEALKANGTEIYIVSAIFLPSQIFFKWYGGFFRRMLKNYTRFFVQDEQSRELLSGIGIKENVVVSGDTRFDRVYQITRNGRELPLVKKFSQSALTFVAGSTWEPDEELLAKVLRNFSKVKLIIAPHEIHKEHICKIESLFAGSGYRIMKYSDFDKEISPDGWSSGEILPDAEKKLEHANVLIIDCLGVLSTVYRYGRFAYIGGGFGVGIHNILEAATYGVPVIFGPNYHKFKEAKDLVSLGGAFPVSDHTQLYDIVGKLTALPEFREAKGAVCREYVEKNLGATARVVENIE